MNKGINMSAETGLGALVFKMGALKFLSFGAALLGAGIMAVFRPPKTRKELFMQGAVALGTSFLFGPVAVSIMDGFIDSVDMSAAKMGDVIEFNMAVYGFLGAIAWGVFGGLAVLRDKLGSDPINTVKDIKNL
jgi:hypothetical protein